MDGYHFDTGCRGVQVEPRGPTASQCPKRKHPLPRQSGWSNDADYRTIVGVDTAKRVIQVYWVNMDVIGEGI